jgi:hypothetical protein
MKQQFEGFTSSPDTIKLTNQQRIQWNTLSSSPLLQQERQYMYNVTLLCVHIMFKPPWLSQEPDTISPEDSAFKAI